MLKKLLAVSFSVCFVCVIMPVAVGAVFLYNANFQNKPNDTLFGQEVFNAEIYIEEDKKGNDEKIDYENIDYTSDILEEYITGVVAAEMPASFQFEALKAQAIAARTYALKHLGDNYSTIDSNKIGQAFITVDDMKNNWGNNFESNYKKIRAAVYSTRGLVLKYNGEPIEAVFHSTSSGITENAENVWGRELPYIKSVESAVDKNAPNFKTTVSFEKNEFENRIKSSINGASKLDNIFYNFNITSRSSAGYVLKVDLGGLSVKGSEIRTCLGLRSTDFEISRSENKIIFTTKGYGHGAGMSQYGAEFMAREGSSFEDILKHYYSGIEITSSL